MNKPNVYGVKQIYPQLDMVLEFTLSKIKEIEDFTSSQKDNDKEKKSKTLIKYIIVKSFHLVLVLVLIFSFNFYFSAVFC